MSCSILLDRSWKALLKSLRRKCAPPQQLRRRLEVELLEPINAPNNLLALLHVGPDISPPIPEASFAASAAPIAPVFPENQVNSNSAIQWASWQQQERFEGNIGNGDPPAADSHVAWSPAIKSDLQQELSNQFIPIFQPFHGQSRPTPVREDTGGAGGGKGGPNAVSPQANGGTPSGPAALPGEAQANELRQLASIAAATPPPASASAQQHAQLADPASPAASDPGSVASSLSLTVTPGSSAPGQIVTATVTATGADGGTPLGTVSMYGNGNYLGFVTLSGIPGNDQGIFTTALLPSGNNTLGAVYAGDTVYAGSSATANVTVSGTASFIAVAGEAFNDTVTIYNSNGSVYTNYTGTQQFSSSDTAAGVVLPAPYTYTTGDQGVHTFPVTLETPGYQTITNTDTVNPSITSTLTVYVIPNLPPVLTNPGDQTNLVGDSVYLVLQGNDPDGDSISYSFSALPAGLTGQSFGLISGTVTATPGQYPVTVTATDIDGLSTSESFTWTINTPVTLVNPGNQSDAVGDIVALQLQGTDSVGGVLGYAAVGLPAGLTIDPNTGLISGTVTASPGTYNVTVAAADNYGYSATQTFTWTIATTLPPVAENQSYIFSENQTLTVAAATGVLTGDYDPQGGALTAELDTGPSHGQLTLNPDGSFTYTPNKGFVGADSFTYWAVDADGEKSDPAVVMLADNQKPGPPTLGPTAVPGNSIYQYRIRFNGPGFDPSQIPLSSVTWQTNAPDFASYVPDSKGRVVYSGGPNNGNVDGLLGSFQFKNLPKELKIWVDYTLKGVQYSSIPITVDLVEVEVTTPRNAQRATAETGPFAPGVAFYKGTPSNFVAASNFKINGVNQNAVPGVHIVAENPQQMPVSRHGLEFRALVTLIGPDGNKGVNDIRVGFVQQITVSNLTATYPTNPVTKLVSTLKGKTFLDAESQANLPWETTNPLATFFNPTAGDNSKEILYRDAPHLGAPVVYQGTRISEIQIATNFTLDVAAETVSDPGGGAPSLYFREATAPWSFNATAVYDWTKNPAGSFLAGSGITAPQAWNTNVPVPVSEPTKGPIFNSMLDPLEFMSEKG